MLQLLLIGLPGTVISIILLLALIKTRKQTTLLRSQSQEIQNRVKELERRNDDLQKLSQEKIQLISLVSHDLKGPFNRIFALTQLINSDSENLSNAQKEYLEKIHQIAVDGLGMVRNMLDSRKLDVKGFELSQVEFDLSTFVSSIVKNYRTLAEKKKIEIVFEQSSSILIKADKLYLGRAIENILSNAVKFSAENKMIFVSLGVSSGTIELSVKDEGPGISKEDQLKLFQRFQQLTAQPTGGESSSGLGLFIVKTIVDKIGGEIRCESEIGEGAKFILRLPNKSLNQK
jgi:two-component system sensor histidine kinase/response regulator